jgi:hypothetical protein
MKFPMAVTSDFHRCYVAPPTCDDQLLNLHANRTNSYSPVAPTACASRTWIVFFRPTCLHPAGESIFDGVAAFELLRRGAEKKADGREQASDAAGVVCNLSESPFQGHVFNDFHCPYPYALAGASC